VIGECTNDIASSEYLVAHHGIKKSSAPYFNLDQEFNLHQTIKQLITNELINAAHDVSDGGLFITLAEMSFPRELGFDIETDSEIRTDAFLFGEGQGRVVVSVSEDKEDEFIEYMVSSTTNFTLIGHVTKGKLQIDGEHFGFINEIKNMYDNALASHLEN
jgi:phosphoribosylformylglycinamidine (FGAM) synthase-like enzyme